MCRSDPNASPWNLLLFVGIGLTAFTSYRRLFPAGHILLIEFILCILLLVPVTFIQLKLGGLVQKSVFGLFHSSLPVLRGAAVALLVHLFIFGTYMPTFAVHSICAGFATVSSERQLMTSCSNAWNTQQCYDPRSRSTAPDNYTVLKKRLKKSCNFFVKKAVKNCIIIVWDLYILENHKLPPHSYEKIIYLDEGMYIIRFPGSAWFISFPSQTKKSPVTEYMQNHFFQTSGTVDDLGGFPDFPTFPLVLLLTWYFIFLLVAFGPRVFAWAVSVMGLVSTVIMIGVLVYGWSMDAGRGRRAALYFYAPNFSTMDDINDWLSGLAQLKWVSTVSVGILPTMGKFTGKGRVSRNLSWLFVVLIFLVFRHLPVLTIAPYQYAATQEQEVPFTAYSLYGVDVKSAVSIFVYSGAHPAASLFYFLAGYIHDVAQLALFVLVILDNFFDAFEGWTFSSGSKRRVSWIIASAVLCVILFLLGLPYMTRGGMSLLQFFDFSTVALHPITWYCAGLGFLVIYVLQKTVALVERIIIAVWVIYVIQAWTVLELYSRATNTRSTISWLLNPLRLSSRRNWFSMYWLTGVFPVVVIAIGVFVFVILSLIQRRKSQNVTLRQPESHDIDSHLSTGNLETENTEGRDNIQLVSPC